MKNTFYTILISLLLLSCSSEKKQKAGDVSVSPTFSKIIQLTDFFAEDILKKSNTNTFAVAIYKDGDTYQNYYGKIHKNSNDKPNDSSLFEIASITKTFTGSLVAKAVLANKISLDDDIRKYLDTDYTNLEYQGQPITIKHLLTHSLGLKVKTPPKFEAFNKKMNSGLSIKDVELYTINDLLQELKTVEVNKKPGTVYAYNSIGPELLAYILEKVNKQPFEKQLNTFFKDLKMHNTFIKASEKYESKLVRGYEADTLAHIDYCPIYGAAGGAISSLPDLATYMKYLIENKEVSWIKEASKTLFIDPEDGEQIGYLWQNIGIGKEEGYYYSKTGTSNGIQSGVLICPDSNYGIVVIVNNTSDAALRDWELLFFRDIEPMLIKHPKINLTSVFRKDFAEDPNKAYQNFKTFKNDTTTYYFALEDLNNFGYDLLNEKQNESAVKVFQFLTEEYPKNANTYDSLGEAYFMDKDYKQALKYFKKALSLQPDMKTSKDYINKIEAIISQQS